MEKVTIDQMNGRLSKRRQKKIKANVNKMNASREASLAKEKRLAKQGAAQLLKAGLLLRR